MCGVLGEEVRAVQGASFAHARVVGVVLLTEVDALLLVRMTGGELAADREPAAPCESCSRHRNGRLRFVGEREELASRFVEVTPQARVYAVAADDEEPEVATGLVNGVRNGLHVVLGAVVDEGRDVDHGHAHAATVTQVSPA